MKEFKIGDHVRVNDNLLSYHGKVGVVVKVAGCDCQVAGHDWSKWVPHRNLREVIN